MWLYERQAAQLPGWHATNSSTRWEVAAVPGLIPEEAFFALLSQRRFPMTGWIRRPEEFDYVVEPDVFHDLFGHVPLRFNPRFADYMQAYGAGGLMASRLESCEYLARLYWYTVEFGLIDTPAGLRAYGAGILPSVNCATASPAQRRNAWASIWNAPCGPATRSTATRRVIS